MLGPKRVYPILAFRSPIIWAFLPGASDVRNQGAIHVFLFVHINPLTVTPCCNYRRLHGHVLANDLQIPYTLRTTRTPSGERLAASSDQSHSLRFAGTARVIFEHLNVSEQTPPSHFFVHDR